MHIGILQTGHIAPEMQPTHGDYAALFRTLLSGHGFTFTTYNVVDGAFPESATAAEGWIITGSKHGVYEDHPWLPPLEALIREIKAAHRPLLGICFGHQVIAKALGGAVVKSDHGWIVGRQDYDFDGETVALNAWHQDQVITLPKGAKITATGPGCPIAGLAIGPHIRTYQAHPEFDRSVTEGLLTYRAAAVPARLVSEAKAALDTPTGSARIAAEMAAFLKQGAP